MTPAPTVAYDANGNTLSDPSGKSYSWDFENRLTQAVVPGTGTVAFKYDPFGRRTQKSGPLGTTNYIYDGTNLLEGVDNSGNVLARYAQTRILDEELSELQSGTVAYYEQDALGSITSLSNSAGALANTYTFDSFGKLIASTGTLTNPFQYTAREFDPETGTYEYRTRYFDQNSGRFISEDPITFDGGINFYRYAQNNPALFTDPMGLSPSCLGACIKIYYGLTRDAGVTLGLTTPVIPYAGLGGATGATSVASALLREIFPCRFSREIWAPTISNIFSGTRVSGAVAARWLNVVGWGLAVVDVYGIQDCTRQCYRDDWFHPCPKCQQGGSK
jgi:RHS repeat-associated protein